MGERNTVIRSLHDLGLAAWFGGTLANAVALNPAAAEASGDRATGAVANTGWDRWTPVNAAAIGAHVLGATGLLVANKGRVVTQRGVGSTSAAKTVVMAAALGVTAYSRMLGQKVSAHHDVAARSGTEPAPETPPDVQDAMRQLRALQWAVPALTAVLVILNAFMGEQQRPGEVRRGILARLRD